MAKVAVTVAEAMLYEIVGPRTFVRARQHLEAGDLVKISWDPATGRGDCRLAGRRGNRVTATVTLEADGRPTAFEGSCTCGQTECAHPTALVLANLPSTEVPHAPRPARKASWESAIAKLVRDVAVPSAVVPDPEPVGLGLQFEVVPSGRDEGFRIALRPVVPGRTGWIRTGISWSSLSYANVGRSKRVDRYRRLLGEIVRLASPANDPYGYYYGGHRPAIYLDEFESRRIWDLLAEADDAGLTLVQPGKHPGPVMISRNSARVSVRVDRVDGELVLGTGLSTDGTPIQAAQLTLVGQPAHGVAWLGESDGTESRHAKPALRLAPLATTMSPKLTRALASPGIRIPAAEEERFFDRFYPDLLRQVEVIAADPAIRLPAAEPATLAMTMTPEPGHRLRVEWGWHRVIGGRRHPEPLRTGGPDGHREELQRRVVELVAKPVPELLEQSPAGLRLAAVTTIAGDALIRLLGDVVPRLAELRDVEVVAPPDTELPDYQETFEAPAITFTGGDSGEQDWFDLSVRVSVGGEPVDFVHLFAALAQDQQYLILPSGTYFALDRPEFRQLRELIAESRTLTDAPPGLLRVGRFQAGLWDELADLGEVTGQAAAWQQSVRALGEADPAVEKPVPAGVRAQLRPYQRDGFRWLATLHDHGLGGVLADDMGLGKTLQTLALFCHARGEQPFLVVCPASVVDNWAREAARFTPELAVAAITQTVARRGSALADTVAGAHVVVTSYTLFRLEYDDYRALGWAGLILDEAQFVKNSQSQAHRCAKLLPAPFKLAITGTPMENNLGELWALCSITAPGLLPRADRFVEYYRNPIEKERDAERLAQLRRRIRPLMLRRRKADVAADLPPKQEQVLEIELDRKHRRVYQAYLQRERQKVLGLLGDLEKNRFEIFRSLTLLRQASLDVSLVDPQQHAVPSTKLDVLTDRISALVSEGHRSLVFSQFTRFLGRARQRLEQAGIGCSYLDGTTRDRAAVIDEFKNGSNPVFLISLKAGGFGLNLTEADYCLLLDPWWNPAAENQAVDRVHRIGQTRHVMVYRLVAKDTIEEKVMALKARKAELFTSVLDGGEFASAQLTANDIRSLLE